MAPRIAVLALTVAGVLATQQHDGGLAVLAFVGAAIALLAVLAAAHRAHELRARLRSAERSTEQLGVSDAIHRAFAQVDRPAAERVDAALRALRDQLGVDAIALVSEPGRGLPALVSLGLTSSLIARCEALLGGGYDGERAARQTLCEAHRNHAVVVLGEPAHAHLALGSRGAVPVAGLAGLAAAVVALRSGLAAVAAQPGPTVRTQRLTPVEPRGLVARAVRTLPMPLAWTRGPKEAERLG